MPTLARLSFDHAPANLSAIDRAFQRLSAKSTLSCLMRKTASWSSVLARCLVVFLLFIAGTALAHLHFAGEAWEQPVLNHNVGAALFIDICTVGAQLMIALP